MEITGTSHVSCDTRKAQGSPLTTTEMSVDWSGISLDGLKAIALSAIIIKVQAKMRAAKEAIPAHMAVRAIDYVPGTRAVRKSPLEAALEAAAADPAIRAELIAQLTAQNSRDSEQIVST